MVKSRCKNLIALAVIFYIVFSALSSYLYGQNTVSVTEPMTTKALSPASPVTPISKYPEWRWTPMDNYNLQFFSAYLDKRITNTILIRILVYKTYNVMHEAGCIVQSNGNTYHANGTFDLIAIGSPRCEGGCAWKYEAHHFLCTLDSNVTLGNKSYIQIQLRKGVSDTAGSEISSHIPIYVPTMTGKHEHYLTMCPPSLQNNFNDWLRLVTYVEVHKFLGATRFVFYNHSISNQVQQVLQYYSKINLAEIVQWPSVNVTNPPPQFFHRFESTSYKGQMLAMNDCYMRLLGRSKYVANTDIDEFLWVKDISKNALVKYIQIVDRADLGVGQVSSTFGDALWPSTSSIAEFDPKLLNLKIFESFKHHEIFRPPMRSKMIVKPEAAHKITVHNPFALLSPYRTIQINTSSILIYHLRQGGQDSGEGRFVKPFTSIQQEVLSNIVNTVTNLKQTT